MSDSAFVHIDNLHVEFKQKGKTISAVNGVTFDVNKGESLVLIGESGSGKSVTLRALMQLHPKKTSRSSGTIEVDGKDILGMSDKELRDYRGVTTAMIFQEPLSSMDPVYKIGKQIMEGIIFHEKISKAEARLRALNALKSVKIPSPEQRLEAYPHELSGGMRQRAMIALVLACNPELILADEPTTALDATVQIQILLLLREQQKKRNLSIIFVTHDIGVAVEIADRIAVMYAGRIVEHGSLEQIINHAEHPYTQLLLNSRPKGGLKKGTELSFIKGSPPDLAELPQGCAFADRCPFTTDICHQEVPLDDYVAEGHHVSCHHWKHLTPQSGKGNSNQ